MPDGLTAGLAVHCQPGYKLGLTASLVLPGSLLVEVGLIKMSMVFVSQKLVSNVRDEMAEFVVQLREEINDSLIRRGMQNNRGLYREGLAVRGKKEQVFKLKFDLQPGSLTVQVAGEHQPYRKHA